SYVPHDLFEIRRGASQVDGSLPRRAVAALAAFEQLDIKLDRLVGRHSQPGKRDGQLDNLIDAYLQVPFRHVTSLMYELRGVSPSAVDILNFHHPSPARRLNETDSEHVKVGQRAPSRAIEIGSDQQGLQIEAEINILDRPSRHHGHRTALVLT